jgi:3-dehydroquinate synthase
MEVLLMSKSFTVKSSIQDYHVKFSTSLVDELNEVIKAGDYIIVDKKLIELQEELKAIVSKHDKVLKIDAEEPTKSYEGVIPFIDQLISDGFKRNNRLIAIGGGITQDVTAFIASILYRGVQWLFFPTTLLAQGDSCIGSKTSINFRQYKNQIGNFYPPQSVFIVPSLLETLEERDIRSGIGEMAHYFFVSGDDDVTFFESNYKTALANQENLIDIIESSLAIKKRYIEKDEFDRNERLVFNYGHTFGHAIESITNYAIPHGVSVSFGMDMANYVSLKKGYINNDQFLRAHSIFKNIWEGYSINELNFDELLSAMKKDKKNKDGNLGLILTKGWGNMFRDFTKPDVEFQSWIQEYKTIYHK